MLPEDIADRQAERELRLRYARWWIYILVVQLVVMNVVFVLVGAGGLVFPGEWSLNIFMAGTLAEVFLVVREIVKYLFPSPC